MGTLPFVSASCALGSYWLGQTAVAGSEKIGFLAASVLSSTIMLWSLIGIILAVVVELMNLSSTTLQKLWVFRPIIVGVIGTAAVTTPAQAADVVVTQSIELNSPFFTGTQQPISTGSLFFEESNPAFLKSPDTQIEIVQTGQQQTQPSQPPSIFFRSAAVNTSLPTAEERVHVVVQGDTLWDIAQSTLPQGATPPQIMERTHQIFELNTDQLETIDSFIYAGQVIQLP